MKEAIFLIHSTFPPFFNTKVGCKQTNMLIQHPNTYLVRCSPCNRSYVSVLLYWFFANSVAIHPSVMCYLKLSTPITGQKKWWFIHFGVDICFFIFCWECFFWYFFRKAIFGSAVCSHLFCSRIVKVSSFILTQDGWIDGNLRGQNTKSFRYLAKGAIILILVFIFYKYLDRHIYIYTYVFHIIQNDTKTTKKKLQKVHSSHSSPFILSKGHPTPFTCFSGRTHRFTVHFRQPSRSRPGGGRAPPRLL